MTSNRLFFNIMREDLRHKTWMIAMSVLTSVLMLPVVWLIWWSNRSGPGTTHSYFLLAVNQADSIKQTIDFFKDYLMLIGGLQTIAGALVTGLFGFRYVFHKNMIDTYHSLPVKRGTLFAACFTDGILIWLLPFSANLLATVAMAGCFLKNLGGDAQDMGRLFGETFVSFLALTAAFLLVYSMVLTAVMLSGNLLNTLVSMAILGFGAISAFGIGYGFFAFYMERFYDAMDWSTVVYGSPFAAGFTMLYWRAEQSGNLAVRFGAGFLLAAALGWCAWRLYRERTSELAEQGVRNKPAAAMMRLVAGIVAGMCGWLLFVMLAGKWNIFWGIFGLVLATVLVFIVLNIIFAMDFKAFLDHKRQLAAVLAVTLVVCFAFHWDWFGYDEYLPKKEDIAEIAVYKGDFTNRYFYFDASSEGNPLKQMSFQDADAIYACLERLTDKSANLGESKGDMIAKVTLKSGRSYYRRYSVNEEDQEVLWPLLSDPEYVRYAFCVSDEVMNRCDTFTMRKGGERTTFKTAMAPDAYAAIVHAYNQDVLEDPEGAFLGEGRLLAQMDLNAEADGGGTIRITLSIYETMQHTVEALREGSFEEWIKVPEASEVQAIVLALYNYYESATASEIQELVREAYGVPSPEESATSERSETGTEIAQTLPDREIDKVLTLEVPITDPAELEELLSLISFASPYRGDQMFGKEYVKIYYIDAEGNGQECYFPKGLLPEKYISRFGDCS